MQLSSLLEILGCQTGIPKGLEKNSRGGRRQKLWQLEITELLTFLYVVGKLSRTDYRSGIKIDQTGFSIHAWPCR